MECWHCAILESRKITSGSESLFADGKLGFGAVNLVFAVMFVVFEIVFLIKRSREKRDLSEEKAE